MIMAWMKTLSMTMKQRLLVRIILITMMIQLLQLILEMAILY